MLSTNGVRSARLSFLIFLVTLAVSALAGLGVVQAGGGPQNVLLVVNPRSAASLTIANHYMALRNIPSSHVLYLDWSDSPLEAAPIDGFRAQVLEPVLQAIQNRGLAGEIDCVAYSSDFPYRIDAQKDLGKQQLGVGFAPFGTINSLTYLYQLVMARQASPTQLEANFYYSRPAEGGNVPPSRAFHFLTGWNQQGEPVQQGGQHHLLSTMLGVTVGRGNSVREVVGYLRRGAAADATSPKGTIYFCATDDVRTKVRQPLFNQARLALQQLGVAADIANSPLPEGKKDVQGLVCGTQLFDWTASRSTLLKGALCDNLTSTGGFLHDAGNQTSLCEFLRAGAAGASGTTVEPMAIPNKFPSPFMQVHYARGCSLAESFYQSVHAPFQLLIVGDPLCQPWARPAKVTISGVDPNGRVSGKINLAATATPAEGETIGRLELFVDGRRAAVAKPGDPLEFDSNNVIDGAHELTIVAVNESRIETQGRAAISVSVNNHERAVAIKASNAKPKFGQTVDLHVEGGSGTAQIAVFHASRAIARVPAQSGDAKIDSRVLGMGPVRLLAVALDDAAKPLAISVPEIVNVQPPDPLPSQRPAQGKTTYPGLSLTLASGRRVAVDDTGPFDWLERAGVGEDEPYRLAGYVDIPEPDVYQFVFTFMGNLSIRVDGQSIYKGTVPEKSPVPWHYVPVSLAVGTHKVEIQGQGGKYRRLEMRFGGPGAWLIGRRQFRHEG